MPKLRSLLFLSPLLVAAPVHAQFTDVINSNRPGESMAAFSVGKTVFQAEAGLYGLQENHNLTEYELNGFGGDLALRYGAFFEQLELIAELQYQRAEFTTPDADGDLNGIRQAIIGAKYLVYDPNKNYERKPDLYSWKKNHSFRWRDLIPSVGLYAGVNLNLFDSPYYPPQEEKISPKLMLLTQHQFNRWVFVTNVYADKLITNYMAYGYILTLTRGFNERLSGFIEHQGIKSDFYSDGIFRGGAAYLLWENIQVDASIGANIKNTPGLVTGGIGLSWRFDDKYEEVYLRQPKDEPEKSKNDKKKEKEKKRKRKDAVPTEEKPE